MVMHSGECFFVIGKRKSFKQTGSIRAGVTLVEILVAIGILAILVAILLPLFSRSKLAAYSVQCSSNMKQLGNAFAMYAQDWDDWWPSPGGLTGDYAYWAQTGMGGLEVYIYQRGVKSIWCCPLLNGWSGVYDPRSYSMNSYLRRPADIEYPTSIRILGGARLLEIEEPTRTILLFEGLHLAGGFENQIDYIYRCGNWTCVSGYADGILHTVNSGRPWHHPVNNYLFCDGHVKARAPGRKTVGLRSTWKEMREWYMSKEYFYRIYGDEPE